MTRWTACGHRRCAAARWALIGGGAVLLLSLPVLRWRPSLPAAAMSAAGAVACFAAIAVPCGSAPPDPGSLDEILADPPLPRRWTRADWAELDNLTSSTPKD